VGKARIKIDAASLVPGMFVAQLDRPWLETPFLFQGFEVREIAEVNQLRYYCQHVYVDPARSSLGATEIEALLRPRKAVAQLEVLQEGSGRRTNLVSQVSRPSLAQRIARLIASLDPSGTLNDRMSGIRTYRNKAPITQEAPKAKAAYRAAVQTVNTVLEHVQAGRGVDVENVQNAVSPVIDSVMRNPDAMVWLVTLQKKDEYSYHHSIASSVWAVVLGRHLGFDSKSLETLAIGGMLLDVGKARLPPELLQKEGDLSAYEVNLLRQHVDYSMDMVSKTPGIGREVLDMIEYHHERFDGSGYPKGVVGSDIPVYGRISGLVDCYDAMITARVYAPAMSTYDAIRELNVQSGVLFQRELVEQFVQAMGMFPTGSLVELNSGEVGIVIEQNRVRRLRPKVMILLDANKEPLNKHKTVDLRKLPSDAGNAKSRWIGRGHEAGAFGINPKDYFM
jgi:HD-GYP domain-containing protein (c-di-GMP phosphodiesterase class II)